jgi:hypothetical protein
MNIKHRWLPADARQRIAQRRIGRAGVLAEGGFKSEENGGLILASAFCSTGACSKGLALTEIDLLSSLALSRRLRSAGRVHLCTQIGIEHQRCNDSQRDRGQQTDPKTKPILTPLTRVLL